MHLFRLIITATLLFLLLFITILYAFSWTHPQCLGAWKSTTSCMLATCDGKLWLTHEYDEDPHSPAPPFLIVRSFSGISRASDALQPSHDAFDSKRGWFSPSTPTTTPSHTFGAAGFAFDHDAGGTPGGSVNAMYIPWPFSFDVATIPLWFLWLPLAVTTGLVTRRTMILLRRSQCGLCNVCGYDLRASRDRCPECGTPIALMETTPMILVLSPRRTWNWLFDRRRAVIAVLLVLLVAMETVRINTTSRVRFVYVSPPPATMPGELAMPVHLNFDKTPFSKVLQTLAEESGASILPHWREMVAADVGPDAPVTVHLNKTVSLREALKHILHEISAERLIFVVDERGIIHVGCAAEISEMDVAVVVYDIRDILAAMAEDDPLASARDLHGESIAGLIKETVLPDIWRDNGGMIGSITIFNGRLTISATHEAHWRIDKILRELHEHPTLAHELRPKFELQQNS